MAIKTVDALFAALRRAELFSPEELDEAARELGPAYDNPYVVAEHLVDAGWLTPFQVRILFDAGPEQLALGPYQLLDRAGEGRAAEVFRAWDTARGREVALKVLRPSAGEPAPCPRVLGALPRLNHPNIVRTYDAGRAGPAHFAAMECVEGLDLEEHAREAGPLPVGQACDFARQAAQGLQHAYQLGVVHRAVNPSNLFLVAPPPAAGRRAPELVVKVFGWGLARLRPPEGAAADADAGEGDPEAEEQALVDTGDYVAPEQAGDPRLVDTRADVYGLGCTLYYLLTGQPPFPGASLTQKLRQHRESPPPSARAARPDVPEELDAAVRRMMAKRPQDRFPIPLLAGAALRKFCATAPPVGLLRRPTSPSKQGHGPRPPLRPSANGTGSHNGAGPRPRLSGNGAAPRPNTGDAANGR
jgi:serine/threonine-protein kinase